MQQFSPKQHAAAAVSPPQGTAEKPFFAPPSTDVFLLSANKTSTLAEEIVQTAIPASLPSAAVATAAADQQQALLANLATEFRGAIDRWCPVGRDVCAAATDTDVKPQIDLFSHAVPRLSSSCTSLPPCCGEDGEEKEEKCHLPLQGQQQQPSFFPAKRGRQALGWEEEETTSADAQQTDTLKSPSSSNTSHHDDTFFWRCRKENAAHASVPTACAPRERFPHISEFSSAAVFRHENASSSFSSPYGEKRSRCFYYHYDCPTHVISKTAVSLPTHLYREEAAIEEDAADLLGCLEEDINNGLQKEEDSGSALFYSTGDLDDASRILSTRYKDYDRQQNYGVAQPTTRPHSSSPLPSEDLRFKEGCSLNSNNRRDNNSKNIQEDFSSHWGEWPLRKLSSESIQQYTTPATETADTHHASRSSTTTSTSRAAIPLLSYPLVNDVKDLTKAKKRENTDISHNNTPPAETAIATASSATTAITNPAVTACCWETSETLFKNISSSHKETQTKTTAIRQHTSITPALSVPASIPAASLAAATLPAAGSTAAIPRSAAAPPKPATAASTAAAGAASTAAAVATSAADGACTAGPASSAAAGAASTAAADPTSAAAACTTAASASTAVTGSTAAASSAVAASTSAGTCTAAADTATPAVHASTVDAASSIASCVKSSAAATLAFSSTGVGGNVEGERHRSSCPVPAPLPALSASSGEQFLRSATLQHHLPGVSTLTSQGQAAELASLATASTDIDAVSLMSLESVPVMNGVNPSINPTSSSRSFFSFSSSSSSSAAVLSGSDAEKRTGVDITVETDTTLAEGKRKDQRLRSFSKSYKEKEDETCKNFGFTLVPEQTEEDLSVSRRNVTISKDSEDERSCSDLAIATAVGHSRSEAELSVRGCVADLHNGRDNSCLLKHQDNRDESIVVSGVGSGQTSSNEREEKAEFLTQRYASTVSVRDESPEKTSFADVSGRNDTREDGRCINKIPDVGNNDSLSNYQTRNRRQDGVEGVGKSILHGRREDIQEKNNTGGKISSSHFTGKKKSVTTFEEVGVCITSPCIRSSSSGAEEKDNSGGKPDITSNNDKIRNTLKRKMFFSRSSSVPSAQQRGSPRAAISRLNSARVNHHSKSPRLLQRRQRCLSVVAGGDAGDDMTTGLLKSPTRSTLFCTNPVSSCRNTSISSSLLPRDPENACWGVSTDKDGPFPLLSQTKNASPPESVFPEKNSHKKYIQYAAGRSETKSSLNDEFSQRITTSFVQDVNPIPQNQATIYHPARPAARHPAATVVDKSGAGTTKQLPPPETASEIKSGMSNVQGERKLCPGSPDSVLLQNPAEAAVAAATKAAAAAAAVCRKSFDLSSPVIPDTISPDFAARANAEGFDEFVCAWLEGCCTRLQIIARKSSGVALSQQILDQQPRTVCHEVSQAREDTDEAHAFLLASKRQIKEELKDYDAAFHRRYGRLPGRPEKEALRPLYSHYQLLRRLLVRSGKHAPGDMQAHSQRFPVDGVQYCAASSSGSAALNVGENCEVKAGNEETHGKVTSSSSGEAAEASVARRTSASVSAVGATAAGTRVTSAPAHFGGENVKFVAITKDTQLSETDIVSQSCHSALTYKERRPPSITIAGAERADVAAALSLVEGIKISVDAETGAESTCGGARETAVCHRVRRNSRARGTTGGRPADRLVSERESSFTSIRDEGAYLATDRRRVEGTNRLQEDLRLRNGESVGDEQPPVVQHSGKGSDQMPFRGISSVVAIRSSAPAAARNEYSSTAVESRGNSVKDGTVLAHTSNNHPASRKPDALPDRLSVHSHLPSQARRETSVSGKKGDIFRQERCLYEGSFSKARSADVEHNQVIGAQSFLDTCAPKGRDTGQYGHGDRTHVGGLEKISCAGVYIKDSHLQSNTRDNPQRREYRTCDGSHQPQQHRQVQARTPARVDNTIVCIADVRESAQELITLRRQPTAIPLGRSDTRSQENSVDKHGGADSRTGMDIQAVKNPQAGTVLRSQGASMQSQMESMHKTRLPFVANGVTEYQQRLVRLQQEKRMLRTKLLAYQAEFTAETGRVVQLYKDIAPIEREYRRYKEVKQEIARLSDKQSDSIFPAKASQSHSHAHEEDRIPSEKFDKGRREVCAS